MSVDPVVFDREGRSFLNGNVVNGSVECVCDDVLPDCPPGFENAAGWVLSGFRDLCKSGMHGNVLCEIGDKTRCSAGSDTYVVDRKLVDITKGNTVGAASDEMEILNKSTSARRKRNAKEVVESGYVAGSLVWGKIRSHPWWPGQIFDTADLSKEALLHYKDGKFLVAYFGVGTFSWNDVAKIRPFQVNFERMENQSAMHTFCSAVDCALDEVFKRVEFGLSCTCLPENVYADIQSQIVENTGIYKKTRRRDAGDEYSSVDCFVPSKLLSYVKEAAKFPTEVSNKLEVVKSKAQLISFCRWKGYRRPPEYTYFIGLLDISANFTNLDVDFHRTVANNADHEVTPKFAITEDKGEHQHKRRGRGRPKGSGKQNRKKISHSNSDELYVPPNHVKVNTNHVEADHEVTPKFAITGDKGEHQHKRRGRGRPKGSGKQKRKKISHSTSDEVYVPPNHVKVNTNAKSKVSLGNPTSEKKRSTSVSKSEKINLDRIISSEDYCITPTVGRNVVDVLTPDVLFKQLALTAAVPWRDHEYLIPLVKFFSQFRNLVFLNHPVSAEPDISNEMLGKVIPAPQSGNVEESYSMDQIVQASPDVLFKQLALTATVPLHDHHYLTPLVKFFSQFRNLVFLNHSEPAEPDISNETLGKVIPVPQSGNVDESYSMDQIVQASPDVLFKQLALTATVPLHDHDYLTPLVKFFSQFRNSVFLNHSESAEPDICNETLGKVIPVLQSGNVDESYSMDQIVQESAADGCSMDSHDDLPSVVAEKVTTVDLPILQSETVPKLHIFPDPESEETSGNQECAEGILNASGNPDNHKDTAMQTALFLRFSEQGHVPSVTDLNKIFSCYGPLHESETKIMKRSLAKVIFKKHCDAEVAFSSTGKYSIFGTSLISYRLKYLVAKPKTVPSQSRKRQKKARC